MLVIALKRCRGSADQPARRAAHVRRRVRRPVHVPHLDHGVRHRAPGRRHRPMTARRTSTTPARRRPTVTVDVGGVPVGSAPPGRRPVDDQHRHRRRRRDRDPGRPPRPRGLAARPRHRQHRGGRGGRPGHAPQAARPRRRRAGHRRLPLQRPPAARGVPGDGRGRSRSTGSTRATSARSATTSTSQTIVRVAIENDKPVRIGVNWGSLDQAAADRPDGRERPARRAARAPRRDDRRHGRVGDALGRAGRGDGPRPRPDHPLGEGVGRPRPRRHVPDPRGPLRLPAPPRPDRGRHGR